MISVVFYTILWYSYLCRVSLVVVFIKLLNEKPPPDHTANAAVLRLCHVFGVVDDIHVWIQTS